jgi:hypothetical protein
MTSLPLLPLALCAAALAAPALGDEVWSHPEGMFVREADIDFTAVISAPAVIFTYGAVRGRAHLYVEGLPGNTDSRGYHDAYWIAPESKSGTSCAARLTGPDGLSSREWGRAIVLFDRPTVPSAFTVVFGICLYEPRGMARAELN